MNSLVNYIQEKFEINKNTRVNRYKFNFKHHQSFSIILPFSFYFPDLNIRSRVDFIQEETNEFNEQVWGFFFKDRHDDTWRTVTLNETSISNVFKKELARGHKPTPLVSYINNGNECEYSGKRLEIEFINKGNIIDESFELNKNTRINNIYKINDNLSIILPFKLEICKNKNIIVNITKITKNDNNTNDIIFSLYDDKNRLIISEKAYRLQHLLKTKKIISTILAKDISLSLGSSTTVVRYKDDINKIIENPINESEEPKRYSNMILLNHDKDKVLIIRRANYLKNFRSQWGFPGGSKDTKDYNTKITAIRELKEETGIELSFNEERWIEKFDSIKNNDGSISDYYITHLETEDENSINIKLSKEHSKYVWYDEKDKNKYKWMPDVFQIIQRIL